MNVVTRGVRNALRSPLRSGAIVAMLAVSIGLILAMLVARSSVNAKIDEIKASNATQITINPAGIQGGMGGGDPLTAEDIAKIKATDHIASMTSTLASQLMSGDTSLQSALEGGRFMLKSSDQPTGTLHNESPAAPSSSATKPPVMVTGTDNPSAIATKDQLTSGELFAGNSTELVAVIGKALAEKNNLSVGSAFTAYGKTITVKGIYSTDNRFQDSNLILPLATLQTLTDQSGNVSNVTATVDSSDNIASTVNTLKAKLGDSADISSQEEQAENSLAPLRSIADLALGGVIAATIAGVIIILLAMIIIVRERRREIGVIKAIGGSNRSIVLQFITEALTLTIIGGIIGLGIGIAISGPITQSLATSQSSQGSAGLQRQSRNMGPSMTQVSPNGTVSTIDGRMKQSITNITSTVTPQTFGVSAALVIIIATIGSAIPAWLIARVRPAEVLRTE